MGDRLRQTPRGASAGSTSRIRRPIERSSSSQLYCSMSSLVPVVTPAWSSVHRRPPAKSDPNTITHWNRWWPGRNVVVCPRSAASGSNRFRGPGGTVTGSKLWLK